MHWPAGLKLDPGAIVQQPAHLIDVLPTLTDLAKTEIPDSFENRQLRPVSGISLQPLLRGEPLESRPPIHLLFAADRGLRDGNWKLVSFQGETWELYNVADDRCEMNNLANQEPERLQKMIATWNKMAADVLRASAKARAPVKPASLPHRHREWTNFAAEKPADYQRKKNTKVIPNPKEKQSNANPADRIRALKNTTLKIVGNELRLQFTGDDPGIAMDLRNKQLPNGPYQITFRLKIDTKSNEVSEGEVFYTTDTKTILPKGNNIPFAVESSDAWHTVQIPIAKSNRLYQLRIDIGDGPGMATIADLQLNGSDGKILQNWPQP